MKRNYIIAGLVSLLVPTHGALACDVCALYHVSAAKSPEQGTFYAGTGFQLNNLDDVRLDGDEVDSHGQKMTSSTLQLVTGYQVTKKFGLQLNTPFIFRHYKRLPHSHSDESHSDEEMHEMADSSPENDNLETGNEDGLGDMSAMLTLNALNRRTADWFVAVKLLGGLKLPTGDTSRLKEENADESSPLAEDHSMHDHSHMAHAEAVDESHTASIHGHDLALGSGSFDFPLVLSAVAEYGPIVTGANLQYTFRTTGDSSYRYADDFIWRVSSGYRYFVAEQDSVALHVVMNGEAKDKDEVRSQPVEDTGLTTLFLGPELEVIWGNLSAEVGLELPLVLANTGLQSVTSSRWRCGITYRF